MLPRGVLTVHKVSQASSTAIVLLVLANLAPLAGVLFLGWDLVTLLFLYWVENGVIGAYAIARAMTASGETDRGVKSMDVWAEARAGRQIGTLPGLAPDGRVPVRQVRAAFSFSLHYGAFWLAHGFILWQLIPVLEWAGEASGGLDILAVIVGGVALVISHGASFRNNWLRGGEYLTATPAVALSAPYVRVFILHVTVIFGSFAVVIIGSSIGMLVLLVALKTVVDLAAHLGERRRAAARAAASGAEPLRARP